MSKVCSVENCTRKSKTKGWCYTHYKRWQKYGDTGSVLRRPNGQGALTKSGYIRIAVPGHPNADKNGKIYEHVYIMSNHIGRPILKNEKVIHINGNRSDNNIDNLKLIIKHKICIIDGCDKKCEYKHMYCSMHWRRFKSNGDPLITKRAPSGSGNITREGYRRIWAPNHPNSNSHGVIFEHRYVMSKKLGRPLHKKETVHHINGNRLDNREENLELYTSAHCPGQRVKDIYEWALKTIELYKEEYEKIK